MSISDVERVSRIPSQLRSHADYPAPGVHMLDMWPVVSDLATVQSLAEMAACALPLAPGTIFIGMATRGTNLAYALAARCRGRVATAAKKVKLPAAHVLSGAYACEYGGGTQEMPRDQFPAPDGDTVFPAYVVDDVVATGGSASAVVAILAAHAPHVRVLGVICVVHVRGLGACGVPVHAAFEYAGSEYAGVGDLYRSWLPVVDRRDHLWDAEEYPIYYYPPRLGHLRNISHRWRPIPLERFPGGVLDGRFDPCLKNADVVLVLDTTDPNLADMISFANILPDQGIASLQIRIPFYAMGTMERVDAEGTIATAETVARWFRNIPACKKGRPEIHVFDIHAVAERFYFDAANTRVVMRSHMDEMARAPLEPGTVVVRSHMNAMARAPHKPGTVVVFPDTGADKRYGVHPRFADCPTLVLVKVRDGDRRTVSVHYTKNTPLAAAALVAAAPRIVVVDDMTRTGGTALEALRALAALGAAAGAVDVWVANVDPADDALFRFFGKAPACFRRLVTSDGTQAAHQLGRHPLLAERIQVVSAMHWGACGKAKSLYRVAASLNPAKQAGADMAVCVPSGVPAQPDADLAARGARNRVDAACKVVQHLMDNVIVYGIESGVDNAWRDVTACAVYRSKTGRRAEALEPTHPAAVVPPAFRRDRVVGDTTFGAAMRRAWNLRADDAWIGVLTSDPDCRRKRCAQLARDVMSK